MKRIQGWQLNGTVTIGVGFVNIRVFVSRVL